MQHFSPIQYLKIDIASNFGLDKEDWDVRLNWFDENENQLDDLIKKAETPALFYAGIQAYRAALKGEPTGYPISLDATASGAQLLAVAICCEDSAKLCNVIDTGKREDFYTNIFQFMRYDIASYSESLEEKDRNIPTITRGDVKDAVMPSLYGSKAMPRQVFGEDALLAIFYNVMETRSSGVWKLNKSLIDLWRSDVYTHQWVLPDNFHVVIKSMAPREETAMFLNQPHAVLTKENRPVEKGISLGANIIHSIDGLVVREMLRRCSFNADRMLEVYDMLMCNSVGSRLKTEDDKMVQLLWNHYERTGFLSARILDHLQVDNAGLVDRSKIEQLVCSMPEKPFSVLAIHDCFRVHPNYGNDLRKQYNQILCDLAKSTFCADIASQILGIPVVLEKMSDLSERILEANYALS